MRLSFGFDRRLHAGEFGMDLFQIPIQTLDGLLGLLDLGHHPIPFDPDRPDVGQMTFQNLFVCVLEAFQRGGEPVVILPSPFEFAAEAFQLRLGDLVLTTGSGPLALLFEELGREAVPTLIESGAKVLGVNPMSFDLIERRLPPGFPIGLDLLAFDFPAGSSRFRFGVEARPLGLGMTPGRVIFVREPRDLLRESGPFPLADRPQLIKFGAELVRNLLVLQVNLFSSVSERFDLHSRGRQGEPSLLQVPSEPVSVSKEFGAFPFELLARCLPGRLFRQRIGRALVS